MKVSILMITYNQEKFIAQAIDSILMQEVSFDYEIVIGEDCSTDNTRNIVIDYQKRYPDRIRLLLPEINLGMHNNLVATLQACQGTYVALLEGDDYWSSPDKLEKQVNFLDRHSECSICFHNVTEIYEDKSKAPQNSSCGYPNQILNIEDLLAQNFAYTCTAMFRSSLFNTYKFPNWYCQGLVKAGDYPLWIFNAEHGKIAYLPEVMGVYRIHHGGVWSSKNKIEQLQDEIIINEYIDRHLNFKYQNIIRNKISLFNYEIAREYDRQGDYYQAIKYTANILSECVFNPLLPRVQIFKMFVKTFVKLLYSIFKKPASKSELINSTCKMQK